MNKMNLLKNKVSFQPQGGGEDALALNNALASGSSGAGLIVNLTLCIGGILALYFYQSFNLSELKAEITTKSVQLSTLRENVVKLKEKSEGVKSAQIKLRDIEKRMEVMKSLSKSRLEPLKALDYLQTIIPDRVWFEKVVYSKKSFTFEGFALSDDDFNTFMSRLENGGVFVDIVPVRFVEDGAKQGKVFYCDFCFGEYLVPLIEKIKSMPPIQAAIIGFVLALIFYLLWFDSGVSQKRQISSITKDIGVLSNELVTLEKAVVDADKLNRLIEQVGEGVNKLSKYIPEKLTDTDVVKDLSTSARSVGATVVGIRVKSAKSNSDDIYDLVSVEVELRGVFDEIMAFLSQLTKVDRIYTLEDMNFSIKRRGEHRSEVSFKTTVVGYRYRPDKGENKGGAQ